jgi:hypothetical protein
MIPVKEPWKKNAKMAALLASKGLAEPSAQADIVVWEALQQRLAAPHVPPKIPMLKLLSGVSVAAVAIATGVFATRTKSPETPALVVAPAPAVEPARKVAPAPKSVTIKRANGAALAPVPGEIRRDEDRLLEEAQRLEGARRSLAAGNALGSLTELSALEKDFGETMLALERDVLRVEARVAMLRVYPNASEEETLRVLIEAHLARTDMKPYVARLRHSLEQLSGR